MKRKKILWEEIWYFSLPYNFKDLISQHERNLVSEFSFVTCKLWFGQNLQ